MGHVVFRRIGGRIVPIGMSNETKERVKGAATIAAGIGVAAGAGHVSATMLHAAALRENRSMGEAKIAKDSLEKGYKQFSGVVGKMSRKTAKESKALLKRSFAVKRLGTVGAAALVGVGVHKILNTTRLKKHPDAEAGITAGSTVVAAFGIESAFLRGVGNRGVKVLKIAAKSALRRVR